MEDIFLQSFIAAVLGTVAVVSFITEQVKTALKIKAKEVKIAISVILSAAMAVLYKYVNGALVLGILKTIYKDLPMPDVIPDVGISWYFAGFFFIAVALGTNGFYKMFKRLLEQKS